MTKIETLYYSENLKDSRNLDIYISENNSKPKTTIAIIPGSNFENGSKEEYKAIAELFCQSGLNVAVLNYRLAPRWHMPAPIEDIRLAIQHLKRYLASKGEKPNQIVLAGQFSGAYLALLTITIKPGEYLGNSHELKDENTQLKAAVLFSPIVSFEKNFHGKEIEQCIEKFLGFNSEKESEIFIRDVSPIHKSKSCNSSILLIVPKNNQSSTNKPNIHSDSLIKFFEEYRSCKVPIKLIESDKAPTSIHDNNLSIYTTDTIKTILNFTQEYMV